MDNGQLTMGQLRRSSLLERPRVFPSSPSPPAHQTVRNHPEYSDKMAAYPSGVLCSLVISSILLAEN